MPRSKIYVRPNPEKLLLVEGEEDKYAIISLIKSRGVTWDVPISADDARPQHIVSVEALEGVSELLKETTISTKRKESGRRILGMVLDADEDLPRRWQSVRDVSRATFPELPESLPKAGLIYSTNGFRFGVWVMPDNESPGMLETLLASLAPLEEELWQLAKTSRDHARDKGAPWTDAHRDKALVHTWLAWRDPPGHALGNAVLHGLFDAKCEKANAFAAWFHELFEIPLPALPSA